MKRLSFCILTLFALSAQSQSVKDHWFFSDSEGFIFENGTVSTTDEFKLSSLEGSVSISDESGELLFYSNGLSIYNRDHEPMLRDPNLGGRN